MTSVFSSAARIERIPRPWTTMAGSVVLHGAAIVAVVTAAGATVSVVDRPRPETDLRFVHVLPIPPEPSLRVPPMPKEHVRLIETPPPEVEPLPIPERVVARSEPTVPDPEPVAETPIEPPKPKMAPTVRVGAFDTGGSTRAVEIARAVQPAGFDTTAVRTGETRTVKPAGFDTTAGRTGETKTAPAAVGAFDQAPGRSLPGTARPKAVGDAGFGAGVATGPGRGGSGAVVSGGFDVGNGGGGKGVAPSGSIKTADFDTPQAEHRAPQVVRQAPTEVPLEILSKPTPAYTDEARAMKLEGQVVLEVEFAAVGGIRVLRVVRGLGHGLDESAIRAVQSIRFKPAQRNGQPVDIRTTLSIVFRVA